MDKDKQRDQTRTRVKRYRAKAKSVTDVTVTPANVTQDVTPCLMAVADQTPYQHRLQTLSNQHTWLKLDWHKRHETGKVGWMTVDKARTNDKRITLCPA